ncbi:hypothetical protein ACHAXT_009612 [Thalassiosira profunda]
MSTTDDFGLTDDGDFAIFGVNADENPEEEEPAACKHGHCIGSQGVGGMLFNEPLLQSGRVDLGAGSENRFRDFRGNDIVPKVDPTVKEWLLEMLPSLDEGDLAAYAEGLSNLGFNPQCASLCELRYEDLDFMKLAKMVTKASKKKAVVQRGAVLLAIVGLLLASVGIALRGVQQHRQKRWQSTMGTVVGVERCAGVDDTWRPVIRYVADDEIYFVTSSICSSPPPVVGDEMAVLYSPANPARVDLWSDWFVPMVLIPVGLFLACIAWCGCASDDSEPSAEEVGAEHSRDPGA